MLRKVTLSLVVLALVMVFADVVYQERQKKLRVPPANALVEYPKDLPLCFARGIADAIRRDEDMPTIEMVYYSERPVDVTAECVASELARLGWSVKSADAAQGKAMRANKSLRSLVITVSGEEGRTRVWQILRSMPGM